jgi:hypothetical protein
MVESGAGIGSNAHREFISREPVNVVRVTEKNLPRFDAALTQLAAQSATEDGMLPVSVPAASPDKKPESNAQWLSGVKGLWLFGKREGNFSIPDQVDGFVNVYDPEYMKEINDWLVTAGKDAYPEGAVLELSSYAKNYPQGMSGETAAIRLALSKLFADDANKHVKAVTMWVTHDPQNRLDPLDATQCADLGGIAVGALRYAPEEPVDSTCFVISRSAFGDKTKV